MADESDQNGGQNEQPGHKEEQPALNGISAKKQFDFMNHRNNPFHKTYLYIDYKGNSEKRQS